jgi:hypothetical protein
MESKRLLLTTVAIVLFLVGPRPRDTSAPDGAGRDRLNAELLASR